MNPKRPASAKARDPDFYGFGKNRPPVADGGPIATPKSWEAPRTMASAFLLTSNSYGEAQSQFNDGRRPSQKDFFLKRKSSRVSETLQVKILGQYAIMATLD